MKKNIKILVAAAAIVFIVWNLVSFLIGRTTSEMVQYGTLEDSFGTTLYLFKDEVMIDGAGDGVLRPTVADGERVPKGRVLARCFPQIQMRVHCMSTFAFRTGFST